jgi:hypothetical protein
MAKLIWILNGVMALVVLYLMFTVPTGVPQLADFWWAFLGE